MAKELNHIDKLFKETFESHSEKAGAFIWTRLQWRMLWFNYRNLIIVLGTTILVISGIYLGTNILKTDNQQRWAGDQTVSNAESTTPKTPDAASENDPSEQYAIPLTKKVVDGGPVSIGSNTQSDIVEEATEKTLAQPHSELQLSNENVVFAGAETIPVQPAMVFEINELNSTLDRLDVPSKTSEELARQDPVYETSRIPVDIKMKSVWLSVGLYISPAYTLSSMKAEAGYEDYSNYTETNESPAISLSAGADLRVNIRNWYIQTGLAFSSYRQNRNYNYTFKTLDSLASFYQVDTTWGWIFDPPNIGDPIVLGTDTTFIPIYDEINEGINEWRYLEIPLLAGYKINKGRFTFDIGTGFSYGLFLNALGNVPDPNHQNRFNELSDLEMNKHIFNYILQLGFSYHLTPNWSLSLSPYYKQNLNSVFEKSYPIDQQFRLIGITFGLRVDL